jgi:hypothetical protein
MPTSKYYREQAQVLAGLALLARDPAEAERFTKSAMEHLERAEVAESQEIGPKITAQQPSANVQDSPR